MSSKSEIEDRIARAASSVRELDSKQKTAAIELLAAKLERVPLPVSVAPKKCRPVYQTKFIVKGPRNSMVSVKLSNYFISWKKILLSGSSIPAAYASSTLSAMTVLGFLVSGTVHVFDEIDARIISIILKNSKSLPLATGKFYDLTSSDFPREINKDLFMKRVVQLSGNGAISIDGDLLRITEVFYSFRELG